MNIMLQQHHLPIGFRTSKIVQNIGDYVGQFMESDDNNFTSTWQDYLRVRVSIDIQKPLKRRMRIKKPGSEWVWVEFRYESLTVFCFICGCLGHTDRKCSKIYDHGYRHYRTCGSGSWEHKVQFMQLMLPQVMGPR